ncbi:PQQ-binding-like beta-propeller repeat protein [Candidatus Margulisiibacteriota bacterium]
MVCLILTGGAFALSPPPAGEAKEGVPEPTRKIQAVTKADWPVFHGNNEHSGESNESFIKPPLSTKWTFSTGGNVWSSPAVVGSVCYIGSSDGKLYAINIKTGESIWEFKTGDAIYSSPAVSKGTVYVGSLDKKLYAVDAASGKLKWFLDTGEPITSSPCVDGDTVYVGSWDSNLYAIDVDGGLVDWKYKTGGPVYSSPAIYQEFLYIGSSDGKLYALNKNDGKVLWAFTTKDYVSSSPCVYDKIVYIGSWDKHLYALNYRTGTVIWKYKANEGIYATPAVSGNMIVFATYGGKLYAADRKRGNVQWSYSAEKSAYHSSPVIANGIVYIGLSYKNKIQAFNLKDGEFLWSHLTGASVGASPAVSRSMLFMASSDGRVYAFGDSEPPVAKVHVSSKSTNTNNFLVKWTGTDDGGSLIKSYDIQYKDGAGEGWRNWLTKVTSTSAVFGPTKPLPVRDGRTYYFQARARDNAGNLGSYAGGDGDTYVTVDLSPPRILNAEIDKTVVKPGSYISPKPLVYAKISDNVGVDPKSVNVIIDKKSYRPDSFVKGELKYFHKTPLTPGYHVIGITARDVSGNLVPKWEIKNLRVSVGIAITNMKIAPDPFNPLAGPTYLYYSLNADATMSFYVYDKFGSLIYSMKFPEKTDGGKKGYNKIEWKGVSSSGDFVQTGEYTFKLIANRDLVGKGSITVQK